MSQVDDPSRRDFLAASAGTLASLSVPATAASTSPRVTPGAFAFEEATIAQLGERMHTGSLTARALTSAYLDRIAALDRAGPQLRAVIELNPDALAIAEALDAERNAGRVRGPLHGIPMLVKDNIAGSSSLAAVAGYPNVTVPAGFITPPAPYKGTAPVGISFFGPQWSDARLLGIAHTFERATRHRKPPVF